MDDQKGNGDLRKGSEKIAMRVKKKGARGYIFRRRRYRIIGTFVYIVR